MHQALGRYVTDSAANTLSDTYVKISEAYGKKKEEGLEVNLEHVKRILSETRRATGVEFLCFRPTKPPGSSSSSSRSAASGRSRDKDKDRSAKA